MKFADWTVGKVHIARKYMVYLLHYTKSMHLKYSY